MSFCRNCGAEIGDAKFCPSCGVASGTPEEKTLAADANQKTSAGGAPIKKRRGCLIPLIVVFVLIGALAISMSYAFKNADRLGATARGSLAKELDISAEQADMVLDVLTQCGFSKVEFVEHDDLLDDMNADGELGYRLTIDGVKNVILYLAEDKTVSALRWADYDLYKDGQVVAKITDYRMTVSEQSALQSKCQETIKEILKSPSTAQFAGYSDWKFSKSPERVMVYGYVDSQNAFGAVVRSEFQFTLTPDTSQITSLIFDGEELIK